MRDANTAEVNAASKRIPRWFRFTPERFIWAALLVEILLWLSEYFRWFSFNEKKGLTVLIALGVLLFAIFWFAWWYASALGHGRRFQFGIRALLVLTVVVAIPSSWLAVSIQHARRDREIRESVHRFGIGCGFGIRYWIDFPEWLPICENLFAESYSICMPSPEASDDDLRLCGELVELESLVTNRSAITDAGLEYIERLRHLKRLVLADTAVTDAGLRHLEKLRSLEELDLTGTNTTEAGILELQSKLPDCKISW